MRRSLVRAALLTLLVAATLPPLVVLCRGRSPSRFSAVNLPAWERKAPQPAQALGMLRAVPLPPDSVQWNQALIKALLRADENRLPAGLEAGGRHPTLAAGDAGAWLESACALGRNDRALAAKQDRVALRLMTAEDADGYLAAGQGRARWTASQVEATSCNLRGLLACYALTHHVAVIYAAMQAGDLVVSTPALEAAVPRPPLSPSNQTHAVPVPTASLVLPLARLYLLTGQERYRQWAVHQARAGRADIAGLCALSLVTGRGGFLRQAQALWKQSAARGNADPDAAACLLAMTGAPGYARVVRSHPGPWSCPLELGSSAFTQTPHGLSVNAWTNARFLWHGAVWVQRTAKQPGGLLQTMLAVTAKQPFKATLSFPTSGAAVTAAVNRAPFAPEQGPGLLVVARAWHGGDRLTLTALPVPTAPHPPVPLVPKREGTQQSPAPDLGRGFVLLGSAGRA